MVHPVGCGSGRSAILVRDAVNDALEKSTLFVNLNRARRKLNVREDTNWISRKSRAIEMFEVTRTLLSECLISRHAIGVRWMKQRFANKLARQMGQWQIVTVPVSRYRYRHGRYDSYIHCKNAQRPDTVGVNGLIRDYVAVRVGDDSSSRNRSKGSRMIMQRVIAMAIETRFLRRGLPTNISDP